MSHGRSSRSGGIAPPSSANLVAGETLAEWVSMYTYVAVEPRGVQTSG